MYARVPFARFDSSLIGARRWHLAVAAAALAACTACGGDSTQPDSGPTGQPATTVTINATPALQFTPSSATLAVGGTATFAFGSVAHDVFFDNSPAGAPANITTPTSNQTVQRTFTTAGRFEYNCHIHPGMKGTITVR